MPNGNGGPIGLPGNIQDGDCVAIAYWHFNTNELLVRAGILLSHTSMGDGYFSVTLQVPRYVDENYNIGYVTRTYNYVFSVDDLHFEG